MPEIVLKKTDDKSIIHMSGNLDVRHAEEIRNIFLSLKVETGKAELVLLDTDNLDLSFLQLLFAFMKSLKEKGKDLTFRQELNVDYEKIVRESGFFDAFEHLIKE